MQRYFYLTLTLLFCLSTQAQHYKLHSNIPIDSSYSTANEYKKHIKKYPFITLPDLGNTQSLTIHPDITYSTYNNHDLHLDVIHPKLVSGNERFPVIVIVHGGGWRSGDKNMDHPMAYELARRGYTTVCVEYRLSMEALYPTAIADIKTAIRWVRANKNSYPFDIKHIAIQGTSAGGQMAALIGSINGKYPPFQSQLYKRYSDKVDAVINLDGVLAFIHPESGEGVDKPGKPSAATLWFGKPVTEDSLSRKEASALTHINRHSAPSLFVNSSQPRFHGGRDDMIKKMQQWNINTEVHQHEDCMHSFWLFNPWFDQTVVWIDEFLKKEFKQ